MVEPRTKKIESWKNSERQTVSVEAKCLCQPFMLRHCIRSGREEERLPAHSSTKGGGMVVVKWKLVGGTRRGKYNGLMEPDMRGSVGQRLVGEDTSS